MSQVFDQSGDDGGGPRLDPVVQCRVIVGAFVVGLLLFAGVVLVMTAMAGPLIAPHDLVGQVLAVVAALALLAGFLIGAMMQSGLVQRRKRGETLPAQEVINAVILRAALIEGPALMAAIAAMLSGAPYLLITAVGCAGLIVMWLQLPERLRALLGEPDLTLWRPERSHEERI